MISVSSCARNCLGAVGFALLFSFAAGEAQGKQFVRGDVNADGELDISDAIGVLTKLFQGGAPIACADATDANDDGEMDLSDAIYLLTFLFMGGKDPAAPYPGSGTDPTPDSLACGLDIPGNTLISWPLGNSKEVDGDRRAAVAYGGKDDVFLVVYEETITQGGRTAAVIAARFVSGGGVPLATDDMLIYSVNKSVHPRAAYNPDMNQFLVVWEFDDERIDDPCGAGLPVDTCIMGLRVSLDAASGSIDEVGGPFRVTTPSDFVCDTLFDEEPDVAWGSGHFLVAWTSHDTKTGKKKVSGQFVSGSRDGGASGSQLLGGQIALFQWDNCRGPAVAYNPGDPCFAVVCQSYTDKETAGNILCQVVTPWSQGGKAKFVVYPKLSQGGTAAGEPAIAYGAGEGLFLVAWPDSRDWGENTGLTIHAVRADINAEGAGPIGADFIASGYANGHASNHQASCSLAYDGFGDRFAVAFDSACKSICMPADASDCRCRIVSGRQDGGDDGGQLIGKNRSLVNADGLAPAQLRPAVAFGSTSSAFLCAWEDNRPVDTILPDFKIFAQLFE